MQEIREQRHITEEMWIALRQGTLDDDEYMQILEHTCDCTWCAGRLAEIMEPADFGTDDTTGIPAALPPAYLSEQILDRTRQLDVQATVNIHKTSKKLQLLLYGLKVGTAVAFSILILGLTANLQNMGGAQQENSIGMQRPGVIQENTEPRQEDSLLDKVNEAANGVTRQMNEFANRILNGGKKR